MKNNIMKEGWAECTLGEICDFIGGGTPSKSQSSYWNGKIPWASIKDIKGDTLLNTQDFITEDGLKNSSANRVSKNEIILATRINPGRPILSKIEASINQDLKVVKTKIDIDISFLFWMFKTLENEVIKLSSGTTVLGINLTNLKSITICFPSLPEQRAIVAKLEELFSSLDSGIADFKTAQQQLKIYRQAVLKKAFEGGLTKEWRARQTNLPTAEELLEQIKEERVSHYNKQIDNWKKALKVWDKSGKEILRPSKPKKATNLDSKFTVSDEMSKHVGNIPAHWSTVHIAFITANEPNSIVDGPFGSSINVANDYVEKGVPVIRINNILPYHYSKSNLKYIREEKFDQLRRHNIIGGDVLLGKVGTIGNSCIYPSSEPEGMLSTTGSSRIRVDESIISNKFFSILLNANKPLLNQIASAAVQAFLNMETIKNFPIPFMTLEEQHQIVEEIETRLSICDKAEESIVESLEKAKALRQSILKKAFEGRLLNDQELAACKSAADYEPASVLLKRIKAEKAYKK